MEHLLEVKGLTVDYLSPDGEPLPAVREVSFQIPAGQVLGVLGESGCGKTTTALSLLRLLPSGGRITAGTILFQGRDLLQLSEAELQRVRGAQLSIIFQEPAVSLNPVLRVGEQIAEVIRAHRNWSRKRCRTEAALMLEEVGFDEIERTFAAYPHQLSGGQRQRVAIAQALACRPRLVIADEPTASVDAASQAGILALLKELKDRLGVAFLLISHRPNVLAELADRVVVMHDGRIVEEGPTAQVLDGVQRQDPATTSSPAQQSNRTHTSESDETGHLLRMQGLTKAYTQGSGLFGKRFAVPALCGVDLEIARGGTLVLVGESGSGKSTMARCAAGLESYDSGTVSFDGRNLAGLNSAEMACIRRQVQVVFQDSASALNPQFTAAEIVAEPLAIQRTGKPEERMKRALELMEQVELSREWAERRPLEFSGGQRQRLAIARALALRPKLLILDESLSGLDSRTQLQVVRLLNELQAEYGLTYLYITHDLNFARHVPGEVAVMSKGKVIERGETEEVFAHPRQPQTQALLAFLPAAEPVGAGTAA